MLTNDTTNSPAPFGERPWAPPTAPSPNPSQPRTAPTGRRAARRNAAAAAIVALIVGAGAGGLTGALTHSGSGNPSVAPVKTVASAAPGTPTQIAATTSASDVSALVANTLPSVVTIQVSSATEQAAGTGFVLSANGDIVTNAHVVNGFTTISVTLNDTTTHPATVLGIDKTDDIAVIHIDATRLTPVELGNSSALRVGQSVVAVGNALDLAGGPSATEGIVSALGRSVTTADGESLAHLVQTDAAINPGNSGGPLLALDGTVIGINSVGSSSAQNIGFAISIDDAKPIIAALAQGQAVTTPYLGVSSGPVNAALAAQQHLTVDHGLYVAIVQPGSPAQAAGLRTGDVMLTVNGSVLYTTDELGAAIKSVGAGNLLHLSVARGTDRLELTATLGTRAA